MTVKFLDYSKNYRLIIFLQWPWCEKEVGIWDGFDGSGWDDDGYNHHMLVQKIGMKAMVVYI